MPTYEYVCQKCETVLEIAHSISAAPVQVCTPELCPKKRCGKGVLKRGLGGGAGLLFKGSGFYITDYRSSAYKSSASADSTASAAPTKVTPTAPSTSAPTPSTPSTPSAPKSDK